MPAKRLASCFRPACRWPLVFLLCGVLSPALAGPDLAGSPPITRFVPGLDVFPQNFAIAQAGDAKIYIGNSEGVLSFNGERWQLIALPNKDIVRSMDTDAQGRVYVGGYDYFGYLEQDETGQTSYHDLTSLYADLLQGETFADVWHIIITSQGVFFQTVQHLFLYVPASGEVRVWRHAGRFGAVVEHDGAVLAQFRGVGLQRYQAGNWQLIPGGAELKEQVYKLLPLPDGGLLTIARDGRWRVWRDGKVSRYPMPAGFPASNAVSTGLVLADGSLALGTTDGSLYFFQPDKGRFHRFQLATDRIGDLAVASDGGLLAVTDEGFYRVAWPPRWTRLGKEHGLRGGLYRAARWGQRWYALTGNGVYEVVLAQNGATRRFVQRDWTAHETWDLLGLDAEHALVADSYHLLLVKDGKQQVLSSATYYPRTLLRSRFDPNVVFVGTEIGFGVVRKGENGWQLTEYNDMSNLTINSMAETAPGELWLGSERGGAWHIRFAQDYTPLVRQRLDAAAGIAYGSAARSTVTWLEDVGLIVATAAGLYQWRNEQFVPAELGGLNALRVDDEVLQLSGAPGGVLWAFSEKHLYQRSKGQLAGQSADEVWQREDLSAFQHGALQDLDFEDSGTAVLTTTSALLIHAKAAGDSASPATPQVALSSVEYVGLLDGVRRKLSLNRDEQYEFTQGDFGVAFRFALPDYRRDNAAQYQGRLVPYEQEFSDWTTSSGYMYSRLSPGDYVFELRARDSTGNITEVTPFRFTVLPYWYSSIWAWSLWIAALLLCLILAVQWWVRLRTRRLALETTRLETMVKERTRALESANHLLNSLAHLDSLTEIPNRRRLDEYLVQTWKQCIEQQRLLAILLIDVDHFKIFNDQRGHLEGDNLLKRLATILSNCLRRGEDLVARYGGEEFLVVLPGADTATAQALAEDMRCAVEVSSLGATISIGVAALQPCSGDPLSDLVHTADAALYEAKAAGRNCVKLA